MKTDMEKNSEMKNPTIHQTIENCQVFNGPISGCVFAMPGAYITQQQVKPTENHNEENEGIVERLKPMFFGIEDDARDFLSSIQGMKPTQITAKVNKLVGERKISEISRHRALWSVLHDCGIYKPSEANWNYQVK